VAAGLSLDRPEDKSPPNVLFAGAVLATLARKQAVEAGTDMILPAMLKELTDIRELAVICSPCIMARQKDRIALSRMSVRLRKLADILEIARILKGQYSSPRMNHCQTITILKSPNTTRKVKIDST
jgi:hypothetical protein